MFTSLFSLLINFKLSQRQNAWGYFYLLKFSIHLLLAFDIWLPASNTQAPSATKCCQYFTAYPNSCANYPSELPPPPTHWSIWSGSWKIRLKHFFMKVSIIVKYKTTPPIISNKPTNPPDELAKKVWRKVLLINSPITVEIWAAAIKPKTISTGFNKRESIREYPFPPLPVKSSLLGWRCMTTIFEIFRPRPFCLLRKHLSLRLFIPSDRLLIHHFEWHLLILEDEVTLFPFIYSLFIRNTGDLFFAFAVAANAQLRQSLTLTRRKAGSRLCRMRRRICPGGNEEPLSASQFAPCSSAVGGSADCLPCGFPTIPF